MVIEELWNILLFPAVMSYCAVSPGAQSCRPHPSLSYELMLVRGEIAFLNKYDDKRNKVEKRVIGRFMRTNTVSTFSIVYPLVRLRDWRLLDSHNDDNQ